jgi:8-oxo-dGTP pyrophosphatase MutT (NUDIX family)
MVEPKPIHPAATVMLLRDGLRGLEVFMVARHDEIDFMAGALVFPGGRVEESDRDPRLRGYAAGAGELGEIALATRTAVIREAFEESGVLLARSRGEGSLVSAERLRYLRQLYRAGIHSGETSILEMLQAEDLELACDLLARFAHWIGPVQAPKRFDTQFYLAPAPKDHLAVHDGTESVDSLWIRPKDALAEAEAGRRNIVFPTRMNLAKLGRCDTVAQALSTARASRIVTVCPELVQTPNGPALRLPPEADYDIVEIAVKDLPRVRHGKGTAGAGSP